MSAGPPEAPSSAAGTARCRACAAELAAGALQCTRCGALQHDTTKCPHCGGVAGVSPDTELRFRCDVCGAPRIPLAAGPRADAARVVAPLKRADAARKARAGWRFGAIASGAAVPMVAVLAVLIGLVFGAVPALIAFGVLGLPLVAGCVAMALRASARGKEIAPALDEAWLAVATDVAARSTQPLTTELLASTLGTDVARAEELLALLDASDVVRGDVTEEGEIAYSSRLRVDAPAEGPTPEGSATAGTPAREDVARAADAEAAEDEAAEAHAPEPLRKGGERSGSP